MFFIKRNLFLKNINFNFDKIYPLFYQTEEVLENGLDLGEFNAILLQKVEELILYTIEQNKQIKQLQEEVYNLKKEQK